MNKFLAKWIVTRSLTFTLISIALVTGLFWLLGFSVLNSQNRWLQENQISLHLNTAKFCMWFLLGYGSIQIFGVKIEIDKLSILEKDIYRAHAQAEFNLWSDVERSFNDDKALEELSRIDSQRVRITGDTLTAKWLWAIGFFLFFSISVFEIIYPAFK